MDWYYAKDGQQTGPVSEDEIRNLRASGTLSDSDLVWNESMSDWLPLGTVPEFSGAPAAEAPAAETPAAAPAEAASTGPSQALSPAAAAGTAAAVQAANGPKPPTYLWQSIVVLILCCLPAAIPALIFATKVEPAYQRGDLAAAQDASAKAKMWCWIAFGVGLVANIVVFALSFAGALAEGM